MLKACFHPSDFGPLALRAKRIRFVGLNFLSSQEGRKENFSGMTENFRHNDLRKLFDLTISANITHEAYDRT